MAGSTIIILSYFAFQKLRSTWRKYLMLLAVMDFMQGLFYVYNVVYTTLRRDACLAGRGTNVSPDVSDPAGCISFAVFGMYTSTSSYLWTAALGVYMHRLVTKWCDYLRGDMQTDIASRGSWWYSVICFGVPAVVQAGLLVTNYKTHAPCVLQHVNKSGLIRPTKNITCGIIRDELDDYGCFIGFDFPVWRYVVMNWRERWGTVAACVRVCVCVGGGPCAGEGAWDHVDT